MTLSGSSLDGHEWQKALDGCKNYFSCWQCYGELALNHKEEGDEEGRKLFLFLRDIASMWLNVSIPHAPLQPLFTGVDGERSAIPNDLALEHLEILKALVSQTEHALMRARFADVLWIRRQGHEFARIAQKAYLRSVEEEKLSHETNGYLIRAYQLGRELNDSSMQKEANVAAEDTLLRYQENFRHWIWRAVDLHVHLTKCSGKDTNDIIEMLRHEILVAEESRSFTQCENILDQLIALLKAARAFNELKEAQLDAAEAFERYAIESERDKRFRLAAHFTEKSIEIYREVGGHREEVDKLQILLREYNKRLFESIEWKEFTVELPDEFVEPFNMRIEALFRQMKEKSLHDSLLVLCSFISSPNATAIAEIAERAESEHVLTALSSSKTFDDDGNVLSKNESPSSPCRQLAIHRGDTYLSLIAPAIERIMGLHEVTLDDLVSIMQDCPLVPSDRRKIFARGLLAGFDFDFLLVAHLLPPQLEHVLRQMLSAAGEITSELSVEMIESEYPLGEIIRYEKLEELIGKDLVLDLSCLLAKIPGSLNLRNQMAHGLLSDKNFQPIRAGQHLEGQADIMYLWALTLKLCLFSKSPSLLSEQT